VRYIGEISKCLAGMGATSGFFCAPFSLAVGMRSYPKLIRDIKKDPAFAHELFTRLTDEILPSYVKMMSEYSGFKMLTGADAWAAYPNINPELAEEWVIPADIRLLQNCMQFGVTAMAVAAGDYCEEDPTKFNKEILNKCFDVQINNVGGVPLILLGMGRWQDYPLEAVAEYLRAKGLKATINAGINARMMRDGPVDKIVDYIKRVITILGHDHNVAFLIASTPADTPAEHVHAAVAAVHTYGKLPLADDLDKVHFEIPKRETFQEYVQKMSDGKGLDI
jgi:hypothetical protein